jgi:hypothetical protein
MTVTLFTLSLTSVRHQHSPTPTILLYHRWVTLAALGVGSAGPRMSLVAPAASDSRCVFSVPCFKKSTGVKIVR